MAKQTHKAPAGPFDYEERALPLRLLTGWVLGLFVFLAAVIAAVFFLYGTPHMHPVPEVVITRPMNQPVLQSNATADLKAFLARQDEVLSTYGWVNRGQGVVRVPIEKAIDMVLQKGFPARRSSP